jgi:hypothetical protein
MLLVNDWTIPRRSPGQSPSHRPDVPAAVPARLELQFRSPLGGAGKEREKQTQYDHGYLRWRAILDSHAYGVPGSGEEFHATPPQVGAFEPRTQLLLLRINKVTPVPVLVRTYASAFVLAALNPIAERAM